MDSKKKFLLGREEYSYQLRDYLASQLLMPHRTCIVVYGNSLKKMEKKRAKMLRIYTTPHKNARQYDVRYIDQQDFRFKAVDMTSTVEQLQKEEQELKAAGKKAKKEKKGEKKGKKPMPMPMNGERRPPRG